MLLKFNAGEEILGLESNSQQGLAILCRALPNGALPVLGGPVAMWVGLWLSVGGFRRIPPRVKRI